MTSETRTPAQAQVDYIRSQGQDLEYDAELALARAEEVAASVAALAERVTVIERALIAEMRLAALESPAAAPEPSIRPTCICTEKFGGLCDCTYIRLPTSEAAAPELNFGNVKPFHYNGVDYLPAEPTAAVPDAAPTDTVNGLVEAARAVVDGWESLDDGRYSISEEAMTNLGIALEAASPGSVLIVSLSDEDEKDREAAERLLDILTLEQVSALGNDRMNRLFGTIHAIRAYGRDGAR